MCVVEVSFVSFLCELPYIFGTVILIGVRDTVVSAAYGLDGRGIMVRLPAESRDYVFSQTSRPALCPIQYNLQWVPVLLCTRHKRAAGG